jgi:SulP family sulfate permease
LPRSGLDDLYALLPAAATMALLSFADSVLTARAFAARHGYAIDANRELLALGWANVGAGLLRGFPIATSGSRTAVADGAGADSKRVGLMAALLIVPFLLFLTPLLEALPHVVLAAIIVVSSVGLIDYQELNRLQTIRRAEYHLALLTLFGVLALGILQGVLVAVTISLLDVIARICRPHDAVLGHLESVDAYASVGRTTGVLEDPSVIVYRFDAPLFFANCPYFLERVRALLSRAEPRPRCFVLDAQAISSLDSSAIATLHELLDDLAKRKIRFIVARANGPVVGAMHRAGLVDRIGAENVVRTVRAGVRAFRVRERGYRPSLRWQEPSADSGERPHGGTYPTNAPNGGM